MTIFTVACAYSTVELSEYESRYCMSKVGTMRDWIHNAPSHPASVFYDRQMLLSRGYIYSQHRSLCQNHLPSLAQNKGSSIDFATSPATTIPYDPPISSLSSPSTEIRDELWSSRILAESRALGRDQHLFLHVATIVDHMPVTTPVRSLHLRHFHREAHRVRPPQKSRPGRRV